METKDYITVAISLLALLFSIIASTLSLRNKKHDDERNLRSLLNDSIDKIRSIRTEQAKYRSEHFSNPQTEAVAGLFNHQINSFTRLAVYITDQIPSLVTDIEYATIADAFGWTGDQQKARQYWDKAIYNSKDSYYEIINRRDYANFLFTYGSIGEGRDQYKRALELSPINDDTSKYMTGYTYRMWGVNERGAGNEMTSKEYFDKVAEAYGTIALNGFRTFALNDLELARKFDPAAFSMTPGVTQPLDGTTDILNPVPVPKPW
jgi:type II secretory pathway pseudopilin PulG